jgi:hypothetical protein
MTKKKDKIISICSATQTFSDGESFVVIFTLTESGRVHVGRHHFPGMMVTFTEVDTKDVTG